MNKRYILMIGASFLLLVMTWLFSGTGFLSSSVLGTSLQSCIQRTITERATCEPLLLAEKKRLQNSIQSGNKKISNKEKECQKYARQNKQPQLRRCRDIVRDMRQDVRGLQQQLNAVESALGGLTQTVSVTLRQCCADTKARNYDAQCGRDGASEARLSACLYPVTVISTPVVLGCMDMTATNYNPAATQDDGSCSNTKLGPTGCTNILALNYDSLAIIDDGSCMFATGPYGCMDPNAKNYNPEAKTNDGSCVDFRTGCMDPNAHNFDQTADRIGMCETCTDGKKNGDEKKIDCGGEKCSRCGGCMDPSALNYDPQAEVDNASCVYQQQEKNYTCPDPEAINYQENDGTDPDKIADPSVCQYCDTSKVAQFHADIQNKKGSAVKSDIAQMDEKQKECLLKYVCKNYTVVPSQCNVSTDYQQQFAHVQIYLALSGFVVTNMDGIYRSNKELTITPTAGSNTRSVLVQWGSDINRLHKAKNECPFMKDILQKELIKDYEPESVERIKVTQMGLTMSDNYNGLIDGNKNDTYDILKKRYSWSNTRFGYPYIAGSSWKVGRATRFGYQDSGDNGRGTPFMDPENTGISTNNTTLQGASLPLPVTMRVLCPNIVTEITNFVNSTRGANGEMTASGKLCQHMISSPDPFYPVNYGNYSPLAVLVECITHANNAGYTQCRTAHHNARVKVYSLNNSITVPLVDIGPSESAWKAQEEGTIDLTYGAMKAVSGGSSAPGTNYEVCFDIIQ